MPGALLFAHQRSCFDVLGVLITLSGLLACSGEIASGAHRAERGDDGDPRSSGDEAGPGPSDDQAPGVDPGTKGLHRLNSAEYNATVADVLGTRLQPANASWLGGEIGGFDNMADALDVDEDQYRRYLDAATLIAEDVFASPALKARILGCASDAAGCIDSIVGQLGLRLFRRPLDADQRATFTKLYQAVREQGESRDKALQQVLRALLVSPEFLFRIEHDPDPASSEKHPLDAYELASRLSYFLWSSAPDDELLAAAADGSLMDNDKLLSTIDRMLADPGKSGRFVENFAGQWLGARKLPEHVADPRVFPDWSRPLAASLTREMYLYFGEFVRSDLSWLDFMKADFNFVDAQVAKLYGMPAGGSSDMTRVEIRDDRRFGFAGLGGFLALSSLGTRTSPTLRGRWILSNLLCTEPPEAPPGVADLASAGVDPSKNVRVALEEHRSNPACAACHALFDPYGLSLEQFDAIGRYRTSYTDGTTIDATAELEEVTFRGLEGLANIVSENPRFSACVTEFMFTYALGRVITDSDHPYLRGIHERWMIDTPSIRRLVHALVLSEPFRYRRGPASK